ncbi:cell division inhibitor SulA [Teredinibacter turnerae]|uniref:cell division inhibitor SulA n=1 Tax=Teredinibacter turnerae TaxID=2426 RepID=UPI0003FBFBCB|nr:SulA-like leucine-rich domain-containing protein [Teredinibacter turnerae]
MAATPLHSASPAQAAGSRARKALDHGVTEIIMSQSEPPFALALPMLAHLSRSANNRWFTWITLTPISKQFLVQQGFKLNNVRLVYAKDEKDAKWMFWEALNNGRSDVVVTAIDCLSANDLAALDAASQHGECRGLLLRTRD